VRGVGFAVAHPVQGLHLDGPQLHVREFELSMGGIEQATQWFDLCMVFSPSTLHLACLSDFAYSRFLPLLLLDRNTCESAFSVR